MVYYPHNIHVKTEPVDFETLDESCEPMDIDTSANSVPSETDKKVQWNVNKFHLNYENHQKKSASIVYALICLFVAIILFPKLLIHCHEELKLDALRIQDALLKNVYGQRQAIDQILKAIQKDNNIKVLFFYGGTGVGKTYTASLMLNDTWNYSNVYHFTMPSFREKFNSHLLGVTFCPSAIIVVDNLKKDDMDISKQIIELTERSRYLKKELTVLLILNCDSIHSGFSKSCEENFEYKLRESFKEVEADKEFIKFVSLTEADLRQCIEAAVNREISASELNKLMKNFNVDLDGCKGVNSKVKVLSKVSES